MFILSCGKSSLLITSVVDKFTAGVIDTDGKFTDGVTAIKVNSAYM